MPIVIGPYQWRTDGAFPYWGYPTGASLAIDLRAPAMCAAEGGSPAGIGLFVCPVSPGDPYLTLGDQATDLVSAGARSDLEQRLGLLSPISANRIAGIIYECLTLKADPQGQDNALPIMPNHQGFAELWAGARLVSRQVTGASPEWPAIRALLQRDYRRVREAVLDGAAKPDLHRRMLRVWMRKFRADDHTLFIPAGLPNESPVEPETTITESFDKADSDTLGPDLSWTELEGDWDVVTNAAQTVGTANLQQQTARADSDLSSTDHYAQCTLLNIVNTTEVNRGLIARKDSSATLTYYNVDVRDGGAGTDSWRTFKRVGGTFTAIGTNTTVNAVANDVLKIECNGSTITRYRNGASQDAATDSAISTGTRCGLSGFRTSGGVAGARVDDWSAADLAAAGLSIPVAMHNYRRRRAA